jgi:hypothetical protein
MVSGSALLTGAGISAQPPASLPLGVELEALVQRRCFEAASLVAPGAVDPRGLALVAGTRRNVFALLGACASVGAVEDLLRCFGVEIPTEAHMLAAVHTARGALHLTLNFDDGVERAYALLRGDEGLTPSVPDAYRRALDAWRRAARPEAPLTIVAPPFSDRALDDRPLLVKLRGSERQGWHPNLVPKDVDPDLAARGLTDDQIAALRAAANARHLAIAGVSGADPDYRTALLPMLRRGRFSWTAANLEPDIAAMVRRIDPSQPTLRPAVEGVRSALAGADALPGWPRDAVRPSAFERGVAAWAARLPVGAAAETYASMLRESGLDRQADAIARALDERGAAIPQAPASGSAP